MEVYYLEQEVEITSDMLYENRLTNQAILVLFQDVAGNHAINLKIDYDHLIKQNMIWVVVLTALIVLNLIGNMKLEPLMVLSMLKVIASGVF